MILLNEVNISENINFEKIITEYKKLSDLQKKNYLDNVSYHIALEMYNRLVINPINREDEDTRRHFYAFGSIDNDILTLATSISDEILSIMKEKEIIN